MKIGVCSNVRGDLPWREALDDNVITVSAFSCHSNPVHPDKAFAYLILRHCLSFVKQLVQKLDVTLTHLT